MRLPRHGDFAPMQHARLVLVGERRIALAVTRALSAYSRSRVLVRISSDRCAAFQRNGSVSQQVLGFIYGIVRDLLIALRSEPIPCQILTWIGLRAATVKRNRIDGMTCARSY